MIKPFNKKLAQEDLHLQKGHSLLLFSHGHFSLQFDDLSLVTYVVRDFSVNFEAMKYLPLLLLVIGFLGDFTHAQNNGDGTDVARRQGIVIKLVIHLPGYPVGKLIF